MKRNALTYDFKKTYGFEPNKEARQELRNMLRNVRSWNKILDRLGDTNSGTNHRKLIAAARKALVMLKAHRSLWEDHISHGGIRSADDERDARVVTLRVLDEIAHLPKPIHKEQPRENTQLRDDAVRDLARWWQASGGGTGDDGSDHAAFNAFVVWALEDRSPKEKTATQAFQ